MTTKTAAFSQTGSLSTPAAILGALMLGLGLLFLSGYAQATILHDAAHDQRHAMAFPCH